MNVLNYLIRERRFVDPKDGKVKSRYGSRGKNTIQWIVIHYTGGSTQGLARPIAIAMQTWKRAVSTHYLVGVDGIFQIVKDTDTAWHCGGFCVSKKCSASNSVSIGVDLVECKLNTSSKSVKDRDWYFSTKVLLDGARLVATLAEKYNIPMENIVRHFDVTGKWCPRPFVGQDINAVTGRQHDVEWELFLEHVSRERSMI